MKNSIFIGLTLAASVFANSAIAGSVTSCDGRTGIDFSDAGTNSNGLDYDVACHETDKWQRLGGNKGEDRLGDSTYATGSSGSWSADTGASEGQDDKDVDGDYSDDGVSWRTSSDGGETWTSWGTDGELTRGEEVQFRFKVSRSVDGNHQFDQLKVWVDWDQNGDFDNTSEVIKKVNWYKYKDKGSNSNNVRYLDYTEADWTALSESAQRTACENEDLTYNSDTNGCNSAVDFRVIKAKMTVPLTAALDTTWLRARVVCENSLSTHTINMNMTAYGYQDQGEVEDYALKIVDKKPPSEVSEPAGILVMSSALMFIAAARRRRSTV